MHTLRMCEVIEQKKKVEDDRAMIEEDKRQLIVRLDEKDKDRRKTALNHLNLTNEILYINRELNGKDVDIAHLRSENEKFKNTLK